MLVDVHTHFYPEAYLALLEQQAHGVRIRIDAQGRRYLEQHGTRLATLTRPMVDLEERLRIMDHLGASVQVLSLTSPNVYAFPGPVAVQAAALVNRVYAQLAVLTPESGQVAAFSWPLEVAGLVCAALLGVRNWRQVRHPQAAVLRPAAGSAPRSP